jgi:hypothetical protein
MFLDRDGRCKVLTPAHVVLTAGGDVAKGITVSDAQLGSVTTGVPTILSPVLELDAALLPLRGADDPALCGSGRVSDIGIQRRIASMPEAHLEMIDGLAKVSASAHLRMRSTYDPEKPRSPLNEEGSTFTVMTVLDPIKGGWSGAALLDADGTFLGMITDADKYEEKAGLAVSASTLRYLIDNAKGSAAPAASGTAPQPAVRVLAGTSPDPAHNQNALFSSSGWTAAPVGNRISFTLLFPKATHFSGIHVNAEGSGNSVEGIELASPADASWLSLNYCTTPNATGTIRCTSVNTTLQLVRVTLKLSTASPMKLSGLTLQP